MLLRQFDAQLVDELLVLGGHDLRNQLLADLSRCATVLRDAAHVTGSDAPPQTPEDLKRDLHELRGIALTIGAAGLSDYCLETETRLCQRPDATARSRFDAIATACEAVCAGIRARRIDPA